MKPSVSISIRLIERLSLPRASKVVGIGEGDFADFAEHACGDISIANSPRLVRSPDDVIEVLQKALK